MMLLINFIKTLNRSFETNMVAAAFATGGEMDAALSLMD